MHFHHSRHLTPAHDFSELARCRYLVFGALGSFGPEVLDGNANICSMPSGNRTGVTYPRFRSALEADDLEFVRRHAREFTQIRLGDALRICCVIGDRDPDRYEAAAVKWLGRFALEAPAATLGELQSAVQALDVLARDPDTAMEELAELCVRHGLATRGV